MRLLRHYTGSVDIPLMSNNCFNCYSALELCAGGSCVLCADIFIKFLLEAVERRLCKRNANACHLDVVLLAAQCVCA